MKKECKHSKLHHYNGYLKCAGCGIEWKANKEGTFHTLQKKRICGDDSN